MSESAKDCQCGSGCNCKSSGKYLIYFFLFVIVIILSGIYYSLQSMSSMCAMKASQCSTMKMSGAPMCPITHKSMPAQGQ